jgi:hypothetical protein
MVYLRVPGRAIHLDSHLVILKACQKDACWEIPMGYLKVLVTDLDRPREIVRVCQKEERWEIQMGHLMGIVKGSC